MLLKRTHQVRRLRFATTPKQLVSYSQKGEILRAEKILTVIKVRKRVD